MASVITWVTINLLQDLAPTLVVLGSSLANDNIWDSVEVCVGVILVLTGT